MRPNDDAAVARAAGALALMTELDLFVVRLASAVHCARAGHFVSAGLYLGLALPVRAELGQHGATLYYAVEAAIYERERASRS